LRLHDGLSFRSTKREASGERDGGIDASVANASRAV
jgi:hypothetical protein